MDSWLRFYFLKLLETYLSPLPDQPLHLFNAGYFGLASNYKGNSDAGIWVWVDGRSHPGEGCQEGRPDAPVDRLPGLADWSKQSDSDDDDGDGYDDDDGDDDDDDDDDDDNDDDVDDH